MSDAAEPGTQPGDRTVGHRLSIGVMLAYGVGDIAQAIKNQGFNILLLFSISNWWDCRAR